MIYVIVSKVDMIIFEKEINFTKLIILHKSRENIPKEKVSERDQTLHPWPY